jgi:hypothetical protein
MAHFNSRVTNGLTRRSRVGFPASASSCTKDASRSASTGLGHVFRAPDGYVIALSYGTESEWVRNVRTAGGCELITRGRRKRVGSPEIRHDESRRLVPALVRPVLRLLRVTDFMHLRPDPRA